MPDSPIRPTDDPARELARRLLSAARFAAIGVLDLSTGHPSVSRIAIGTDEIGAPLTLVSDLSQHTQILRASPAASLLVGEPGPKGDPLTHPRLTLQAEAEFLPRDGSLRDRWLSLHPKAKLYVDFGDFRFIRFNVTAAFLNGGFGKAFELKPEDLGLTRPTTAPQ